LEKELIVESDAAEVLLAPIDGEMRRRGSRYDGITTLTVIDGSHLLETDILTESLELCS